MFKYNIKINEFQFDMQFYCEVPTGYKIKHFIYAVITLKYFTK